MQNSPQLSPNDRLPDVALLDFQLECLKIEMDLTDRVLTRMETITQSTKHWGVLVWLGSVAALLAQDSLRTKVYLAALPVLLFWFIDAWWLHFHRGAFVRQEKMAEFINNGGLETALRRGRLDNFTLLDPYGTSYHGTPEHKAATGVLRILVYGELIWLYGGLIVISLVLTAIMGGF